MLFTFVILLLPILAKAQQALYDPLRIVHWSYSAKATAANEFDLTITAEIEKGWSVYSQNIAKGGPVATNFNFDKNGYELVGRAQETGANKKEGNDPAFKGMYVAKYYDKVVFSQKIKTTSNAKAAKGEITFMTCNSERCLAPTSLKFSIPLVANSNIIAENSSKNTNISPSANQNATVSKGSGATPRITATPIKSPVRWTFDKVNGSNGEYGIMAKADIEPGWYLLSSLQTGKAKPTSFTFWDKKNIVELSIWKESGPRIFTPDANFGGEKVAKFTRSALFTQHIKVRDAAKIVKGSLQYMVCNADGCLPVQTENFTIDLSDAKAAAPVLAGYTPEPILGGPAGDTDDTTAATKTDTTDAPAVAGSDYPSRYGIDKTYFKDDCSGEKESDDSYFWIFWGGIAGGLFALLTPCVFPMLPLTVSFFLNRSKTRQQGIRNAIIYGLSIIGIYLLIGLVLTAIFGPAIGNILSTHWLPNLLFFVAFAVFAFSFFGYYELTLPSSWANATDTRADKGGLGGIFFMAATLVIVSFSCTGPVMGSLLVKAFEGKDTFHLFGFIPMKPLVGMFGFSLALALPFALFALFPQWLKSLPRAGGWMDTLKVTFGFIELAMAFKFLSNIDLVYNIGVLRWEPFLVIWSLLALGLALYYMGLYVFKPVQKVAEISVARKVGAGISLGFMAYMISGLVTYQPLSLLSGLPPPVHYNFFGQKNNDCPGGIDCHKNDLDAAIAEAKAKNKPIFIDFTGLACVNCRKMEDNVWVKPEIKRYLTEDFVVVSLYCDDRTKLASNEIYTSTYYKKEMDEIGERNTDLQTVVFEANSQPLYAILSPDLKVMNKPVGYTPDIAEYEKFLKCGLKRFKSGKK